MGKGATNHIHRAEVIGAFLERGVDLCFFVRPDYFDILDKHPGCRYVSCEIPTVLGEFLPLIRILDRRQTSRIMVTAHEIAGGYDHAFDDACTEHDASVTELRRQTQGSGRKTPTLSVYKRLRQPGGSISKAVLFPAQGCRHIPREPLTGRPDSPWDRLDQRSTSPRTISTAPRMTTASARV